MCVCTRALIVPACGLTEDGKTWISKLKIYWLKFSIWDVLACVIRVYCEVRYILYYLCALHIAPCFMDIFSANASTSFCHMTCSMTRDCSVFFDLAFPTLRKRKETRRSCSPYGFFLYLLKTFFLCTKKQRIFQHIFNPTCFDFYNNLCPYSFSVFGHYSFTIHLPVRIRNTILSEC